MTTHSPYLVDAFQPGEVTWCRRHEAGDVVLTRLDSLTEVERSLSVFSLGELWTGELEPLPASEDSERTDFIWGTLLVKRVVIGPRMTVSNQKPNT